MAKIHTLIFYVLNVFTLFSQDGLMTSGSEVEWPSVTPPVINITAPKIPEIDVKELYTKRPAFELPEMPHIPKIEFDTIPLPDAYLEALLAPKIPPLDETSIRIVKRLVSKASSKANTAVSRNIEDINKIVGTFVSGAYQAEEDAKYLMGNILDPYVTMLDDFYKSPAYKSAKKLGLNLTKCYRHEKEAAAIPAQLIKSLSKCTKDKIAHVESIVSNCFQRNRAALKKMQEVEMSIDTCFQVSPAYKAQCIKDVDRNIQKHIVGAPDIFNDNFETLVDQVADVHNSLPRCAKKELKTAGTKQGNAVCKFIICVLLPE